MGCRQRGAAPTLRPRPCRVCRWALGISFEIELYGATKQVELPFVVGVIADLRGHSRNAGPLLAERRFQRFELDNLEARLQSLRPSLRLTLDDPLQPPGSAAVEVEIVFESLEHFAPAGLARRLPALAERLDRRSTLAELRDLLRARPEAAAELAQALRHGELPAALRAQLGSLSSGADQALQALRQLPDGGAEGAGPDLAGAIATGLQRLDAEIAAWVTAVLHHPAFQRLEAAWRGIEFLCRRGFDDETAHCMVLDAGVDELRRDCRRSARFDHTRLFALLKEELVTLGGAPYAMVVVDHAFSQAPPELDLLEELARIGLALDLVFAAGVAPAMFNMDSFVELPNPRDLAKIFSTPEYAQWRYLRDMEASRHLALGLPRVLGRAPHRLHDADGAPFDYLEPVDEPAQRLWMNPAFVLAERVAAAQRRDGGFAALRGVAGGGLVEGLPVHALRGPDGRLELCCPTETGIAERRAGELVRCGFVPLLHCRGTDYAVITDTPTACRPADRDSADEARIEAAWSDLRTVLAVGSVMRPALVIVQFSEASQGGAEAAAARLRSFFERLVEGSASAPLRRAELVFASTGPAMRDQVVDVWLELGGDFEPLPAPLQVRLRLAELLEWP